MRLILAVMATAALFGSATAGPIYLKTRVHEDPAVLEQERRQQRLEALDRDRRCSVVPQNVDCYQSPSTAEKILRELELMREER